MKLIKMFGLAALAALMAMAFAGASSAMASDPTSLCTEDPGTGLHEVCPEAKRVSHVHETTLAGSKAKLLSTNFATVECDVLFLGDVTSEKNLGNPLAVKGNFTYTNCLKDEEKCIVTETSASSSLNVLKEGHESGSVTGEGTVNVKCGFFINCTYTGKGLKGTAKGPLLSTETNGEVKLENAVTTGSGFLCPKEGKLDITTTPLSPTYITE